MFQKVLNAQVSDATGDAIKTKARNQIFSPFYINMLH